ncbi:MAG: hypothetical protein KGQ46_11175 [Hyphomicrobiales bacterium]|nr:hypothetical protein [Hyphomicrobiales bacterium]MDE2113308.1 hypothetical protein [Hyphomicrobiales bacterium]
MPAPLAHHHAMSSTLRLAQMAAGVVVLFSLFGCATSDQTANADSPLKSTLKNFNFATDEPTPAPFVTSARPQQPADYIPLQDLPPEPHSTLLTQDQVAAQTSQLDATRKAEVGKKKPKKPIPPQ